MKSQQFVNNIDYNLSMKELRFFQNLFKKIIHLIQIMPF